MYPAYDTPHKLCNKSMIHDSQPPVSCCYKLLQQIQNQMLNNTVLSFALSFSSVEVS